MSEFGIQQILLTITGVAATLFPFFYTVVARWWTSQFGRVLVLSDVSLALLVDIALLAHWFDWHIPDHLATTIFALIAASAVMRLVVLVTTAFEAHRRRSADNTPDNDPLLDAPPPAM